jgi:general nucleoside transport system ATP-binding protein
VTGEQGSKAPLASTPAGSGADLALELRGITKRFGSLVANDGIDLDLRRGEVHALLGENGAGKTTLMNIVYGLTRPDAGEILVDGRPVTMRSSNDAIAVGIGMVHQHFMLIPVMTVAENIVLAAEPTTGPLLDRRAAEARVKELSDRYGLAVDPRARVRDIGVGMQQRTEILKALYRHARVLILDEPTAVLTPQEARELFRVLDELRKGGTSVIMITHKLDEVLEVADRITVLRRGKRVGTLPRAEATERGLAELMVGREVLLQVERTSAKPGDVVLQVEDLWVRDDRGLDAVRGMTFALREGEILGIAGVDGNGQTELIESLAGMRRPRTGRILLEGREMTHASPRQANRRGIGHIPEDRHRHGLVLDFTLAENTVLHDYDEPPASRFGFLRWRAIFARARELIKLFDVRGGGSDAHARALSGGNQQKLVLAREIQASPRVLLAAQPTRGLDVGAIEFVHRRLIEQRDAGRAVLLVSFELDEILDLSDRILAVYEGQVALERPAGETDERELGLAMAGGTVETLKPEAGAPVT